MRKAWIVLGSLILLVHSAGCETRPVPKAYQSEPGNFRIDFPGQPKVTQKTLNTAQGPLQQTMTMSSNDRWQTAHNVTYTEYPESFVRAREANAILESALQGLVKLKKWTIHKKLPIRIGPHAGLDVWAEIRYDDGKIGTSRRRYYMIGTRLYSVSALVPSTDPQPEAMDRFVKSFHLLREVPRFRCHRSGMPILTSPPSRTPRPLSRP